MITNQNARQTRKNVPVESSVLFSARPGGWSYSHHASICTFKGRFYAVWSNGRIHEDDCGQRVLISSSADARIWSHPTPLFDSVMGRYNEEVLTAAGFHIDGENLVAYAGCYEYGPENIENGHYITINTAHRNTRLLAKSTRDGAIWSNPIELGVPIIPNHGPQALNNGRLMIAGGIMFPYTDCADGLTGWKTGGIYPSDWAGVFADSEAIKLCQKREGRDVFLCEGAFYQTEDDVIHMLLRSDKSKLWVTESRDNGATWSKPEATGFSNCDTKFHAGRLPDGRCYVVGNPDPGSDRCPLVVTTSGDGENFDREFVIAGERTKMRVPGLHKNGIYGYPHSLVHNGRLYIICSIHKEDIVVYSCATDDLK